ILEGSIDDIASAFIAFRGCSENRLGVGRLPAATNRKLGCGCSVHVRQIFGFDRTRGKICFQATVIAANAEPASGIDGHMAQVAAGASCSGKQRTIHQYGPAYSGTKCQHNDVPLAAGSTPQGFSNQSGAGVILSVYRKIAGGDHVAQELSFQKMQISGQAFYPGRCGIDNAFASDTYPVYRRVRASE